MKVITKSLVTMILTVNLTVLQMYLFNTSFDGMAYYIGTMNAYSGRWKVKEVKGKISGIFSETPETVEYIYTEETESHHEHQKFRLSDNSTATVPGKKRNSIGGDQPIKKTMTGQIARVMSGKIIYGAVNN